MNINPSTDTSLDSEKINVIACFLHYRNNFDNNNALSEYQFLIESAGYNIQRLYTQKRIPTSTFFFGEGFWENLLIELEQLSETTIIVVNTTVTPLQFFHISRKIGKHFTILDQFTLILEIFTKRASTEEAILQIELAKLKYQLPFAKADLVSERISGQRLGFMQGGELKSHDLEFSYKKLESNISLKLEKIKKQRASRRKERIKKAENDEILTLSLLGYTNAGKSSFLNALTKSDKKVEVANQLFTTLGTTSRRYQYHDLPIILTDTVGFFEALPASLINAFRSTLEESLVTDNILILVDISENLDIIKRKLCTSFDTLKEIDQDLFSRVWIILTKIDLINERNIPDIKAEIEPLLTDYHIDVSNMASISSLAPNFNEFNKLITKFNPKHTLSIKISNEYKNFYSLRSKLFEETKIISEKYSESSTDFILETHRLNYIKSHLKKNSTNKELIDYKKI
ncbi:MAG: GTPase HflX [Candidatus Heimdallarchaeota archaeon LC_3]|nr:MAG: GTPase HflX [Candidatus Heimdallarchaeota archaeon LC_3]